MIGEDWGWDVGFLWVFKILCICVFMLLMVFFWCLICGGVFEICNGKFFGGNKVVIWLDIKGDFVCEGGWDVRLFLVLVCKSLCVCMCECVSWWGGVLV